MARRNRRADKEEPLRLPSWMTDVQSHPDGDWHVHAISGAAATKSYRCPGCQQLIPPGTPHLVAWPVDDPSWTATAVDARRHWHSSCWQRWSTRGGPRPA